MATQEKRASSLLDTALLWLAIVVLLASIVGYYYFTAHTDLVRVLGMLGGVVVAVAIALQTQVGKMAWSYAQGSRTELRRMVWPTRRETIQTTLMVVVVVLILAIFIWALDIVLAWAVTLLTGRA
ncbi:preprotein translocase subunit SecE [Salinisphaera aquimarina]|jgi:preprotein translocase subunit SecE|uniref:Protein translocase subunit SecE n=1 Tax=Salinisphaera aquimarina TaxID=2094031 RepID=A0ABV7EWW8_9GAMM